VVRAFTAGVLSVLSLYCRDVRNIAAPRPPNVRHYLRYGDSALLAHGSPSRIIKCTGAVTNATGDLTTVTNADNATAASFTYDSADRIRTFTDSEGWTATYAYDAADRVTKITYPDGTTDSYAYDKLDLASYQDRLGRQWSYTHDADRRLTSTTDPLGKQTLFTYNGIGELTSLTDPNGNVTGWTYDVEGRLIQKTYADTSTIAYTYENTTSRLKSALDALGQTKQYSYAQDNRLAGIAYLSAVNPTPNVSFAYDPYFPRVVSMTDGNGATQYSYVPIGSLGAPRLQQEQSPLASSAIAYAYDALGRLSSRTVAGAGAETFGYDAIGRLTGHANDLGVFSLSYLGQTGQIAQRQLASSTLSTAWSYLPNSGDRRLAGIANVGLSSGQYSTYAYTTNSENFIGAIGETSDSPIVYPGAGTQTASYNNLNQLTNLSGQALSYDSDGNLLSDGQRNYSWDAENRLVGIAYPAQPGKATAFAYDGLSRRTAIVSTPAGGGSTVTTSYIWCGVRLCQARDASNATTRSYYSEGEFVPGAPGQPYYYGSDQIGSARRVFASVSSAPAYGYDPYGNPLQATAPLTDFNYAGMFFNADSGLSLTQYRAYDPVAGRWLSRDPIGEMRASATATNLYNYVASNPVSLLDSTGLWTIAIGGTVNFQFGPFAFQISAGLAIDGSGNIGTYSSSGGGAGFGDQAAAGASFSASTAPTICDLQGPFANYSVGGGVGANGSLDTFVGSANNVPIVGVGGTFGLGFGGGAAATVTTTRVNAF
jgi:RHS repeat-associated protein